MCCSSAPPELYTVDQLWHVDEQLCLATVPPVLLLDQHILVFLLLYLTVVPVLLLLDQYVLVVLLLYPSSIHLTDLLAGSCRARQWAAVFRCCSCDLL